VFGAIAHQNHFQFKNQYQDHVIKQNTPATHIIIANGNNVFIYELKL